jgi:acyl carrier protein
MLTIAGGTASSRIRLITSTAARSRLGLDSLARMELLVRLEKFARASAEKV